MQHSRRGVQGMAAGISRLAPDAVFRLMGSGTGVGVCGRSLQCRMFRRWGSVRVHCRHLPAMCTITAPQKKKISDFEAMLKKMNQSIPRVPMKVPKKSKAAWDYAPVPLIYEVIEVCGHATSGTSMVRPATPVADSARHRLSASGLSKDITTALGGRGPKRRDIGRGMVEVACRSSNGSHDPARWLYGKADVLHNISSAGGTPPFLPSPLPHHTGHRVSYAIPRKCVWKNLHTQPCPHVFKCMAPWSRRGSTGKGGVLARQASFLTIPPPCPPPPPPPPNNLPPKSQG